jgi:hypothetical protein
MMEKTWHGYLETINKFPTGNVIKNRKLTCCTCCTFLAGNLIKSKKLVFNNKGVKGGERKNNNTF